MTTLISSASNLQVDKSDQGRPKQRRDSYSRRNHRRRHGLTFAGGLSRAARCNRGSSGRCLNARREGDFSARRRRGARESRGLGGSRGVGGSGRVFGIEDALEGLTLAN